MASWINITPTLERGMKIVNQIDSSKFRLLVNCICLNLQEKRNKKVFSDKEEEKLIALLNLSKDDVTVLLNAIITIYLQAACNTLKPSIMEASMRDTFNIGEDKASIFSNAWTMHGKCIVDNLRHTSIFPTQVKDISSNLSIQTSSSVISKDVRPLALLQLALTEETNTKITIEFDKTGLIELYEKLEDIQKRLDALK